MNDFSKFVDDKDWVKVEQIFKNKITQLLDYSTIDLKQNSEDVKGEMLARKACAKLLENWLIEMGFYKYQEPIKPINFT